MRRPIFLISVALSIALAISLVGGWAANRELKTKPNPAAKAQDTSNTQSRAIPDHLMYWHMFHHKVMLNQKAEEAERQGRNGAMFRTHYKNSAALSDREAEVLDRVAQETYGKVTAVDARAKKVIEELRAKGPDGTVKPGQSNPEVPEVLKALQKERDGLVMGGVKQLQTELGPAGAGHFDQYVRANIAPRFKSLTTVDSPRNFDPRTDPRIQQLFKDLGRSK